MLWQGQGASYRYFGENWPQILYFGSNFQSVGPERPQNYALGDALGLATHVA